MSVKNDYDRFIAEQKEVMKKELIQFAMLDQEKRYVEPFRIFGNVYYAGDSWVCVHVIDTGDGLLLIDSGNAQATAMLIHRSGLLALILRISGGLFFLMVM